MTRGEAIQIARSVYGEESRWHGVILEKLLTLVERVEAAEREACAKVAWDYGWRRVDKDAVQDAAVEISAAIRARGQE